MTDSWISFQGVSFAYGRDPVINDLHFSVGRRCRILGVLGPSGVGKTTLLNLVAGFSRPQSGAIRVHGREVRDAGPDRPVVFQNHNLFPWMNVLDNVCFGLKARGDSRRSRYDAVAGLLNETGLSGHESKFPSQLSGGMQQRVGLARALAITPSCLLLDEPFGALDERTRSTVLEVFHQVIDQHDINAVHVTHDPQEAVMLCGAILVLGGPDGSTLIDDVGALGRDTSHRTNALRGVLRDAV